MRERQFGGRILALAEGDITGFRADALVCPDNAGLVGGGGAAGALHHAGGREVTEELWARHRYGTPTGTAVATTAGGLPAHVLIHAVGPIWGGGHHGEPELLAAAYRAALSCAAEAGARTVGLVGISMGIYGYPAAEGAAVAVATVAETLRAGAPFDRVTFVLRDPALLPAFERALEAEPGA